QDHLLAGLGGERLEVDGVAFLHPVLLAAGPDDRVHLEASLDGPVETKEAITSAAAPSTARAAARDPGLEVVAHPEVEPGLGGDRRECPAPGPGCRWASS